jgi:hypothetical protein
MWAHSRRMAVITLFEIIGTGTANTGLMAMHMVFNVVTSFPASLIVSLHPVPSWYIIQ